MQTILANIKATSKQGRASIAQPVAGEARRRIRQALPCWPHAREKLERLCRWIPRETFSVRQAAKGKQQRIDRHIPSAASAAAGDSKASRVEGERLARAEGARRYKRPDFAPQLARQEMPTAANKAH